MDMRTGRIYNSREDAIAAGVPSGDVMELTTEQSKMVDELRKAPLLKFSKGSFKPVNELAAK